MRAAESQNSVMLAFLAGARGQERQHAPTGDAAHFRFRSYLISLVIGLLASASIGLPAEADTPSYRRRWIATIIITGVATHSLGP